MNKILTALPLSRILTNRLRMVTYNANHADDLVSVTKYDSIGQVIQKVDPKGNVTDMSYDALLRLTTNTFPTVTLPGGSTTRFTEIYVYGADSGSGAFSLSGWLPTKVTNKRGFVTENTYDNAYRLLQVVRKNDGSGLSEPTVTNTYNKTHKKILETVLNEDFAGSNAVQQTYFFYDDLHRLIATALDLDGDGGVGQSAGTFINDAASASFSTNDIVTRSAYDRAGSVTNAIDPEGNATSYTYDGASRLVETKLPEVINFAPSTGLTTNRPTTTIEYDDNSNKELVTDPNGNQTKFFYDARNRLTNSVLDLNGDTNFDTNDISTTVHYDLTANVIRTRDANTNITDTTYDNAYRVTEIKLPAVVDAENGSTVTNPVTRTTYDKNSNVLTITDPRGIVTTNAYDELNRLRVVTRALATTNAVTTFTEYDANNNVSALILSNIVTGTSRPQTTTYGYDVFDRKTNEVFQSIGDGNTRQNVWAYYRNGNVKTATDPKSQITETEYDRANRVLTNRFKLSGGSVEETRAFSYNKSSKLVTVADLHGATTNTYDAIYRLLSESRVTTDQSPYLVTSLYDANGNRTLCSYPDTARILTNTFDRANRLTQIGDGLLGTSYTYDKNGNRLSQVLPNGVTTTNAFDALNRVTSIYSFGASSTVYSVTYSYDQIGNRLKAVETTSSFGVRTNSYAYDSQYRLVSESFPIQGFDVVAISGGAKHSLALKTDGTVWSWGDNGRGCLGDGTTNMRTSPVLVSGLSNIVSIAAGGRIYLENETPNAHSLAVDTNGIVWAWGSNTNGQLGIGSVDTSDHSTPTQTAGNLTNAIAVAAGADFSLGLDSTGIIWVWGNDPGQIQYSSTPTQIVYHAGGYASSNVIAIAAGYNHCMALKSDGSVWTWGSSWYGQLGHGDQTQKTAPEQVSGLSNVVAISAGTWHSLALTTNKQVWSWGDNKVGQAGLGGWPYDPDPHTTPELITNLNNIIAIGAGGDRSLAVDESGNVYAWGGSSGFTPALVTNVGSATSVAAGSLHSLVLLADQSVCAWGLNDRGQLGNGTNVNSSTPVQTLFTNSASASGIEHRLYTYDLAGNRLTFTNIVGTTTNNTVYTYDDLNRLLTNIVVTSGSASTNTYTYDLNGNRTNKTTAAVASSYSYDVLNRLVSAAQGTSTVFSATYDFRTRRLTKTEGATTTYFRYDGGDSFQEVTGGTNLTIGIEFVRGSGMGGGIGSILYRITNPSLTNNVLEYFTYNAVGHTMALTDLIGAVKKSDAYEAFGNIVASSGSSSNNRLANTKERDASIGLDNHGFRYFDPEIGRYMTRDPIGFGDGLNIYLYVRDNPVNHIDPQGLMGEGFLYSWVADKIDQGLQNTGSPALAAAGSLAAHGLRMGAGFDPTYSSYQNTKRDIQAVQAHGIVGGAKERFGEVIDSLSHNAVQAVDLNNEHTTFERVIYGSAAAGEVFLTVYGGAKTLESVGPPKSASTPTVIADEPTPLPKLETGPEPKSGPTERYNRQKHYGKTPTQSDRKALGAGPDEVVNHEPELVKRYHEGDPAVGEKPGHQMTEAERKASANDRSRMNLQPKKESNQQGAKAAQYSRQKNKELGLSE